MFKRLFLVLILGLLVIGLIFNFYEGKTPDLKEGDLIFQTNMGDPTAAAAIMVSSKSLFSHTGILKQTSNGWVVIHAIGPVKETPLKQWIKAGVLRRYAVYRYRDITEDQQSKIVHAAEAYDGLPYDLYYAKGVDEIYCSELGYLAYEAAGVKVGIYETIKDLDIDNPIVKNLVRERWENHPLCRGKGLTYEECYKIIEQEQLVTPASLARDVKLELIGSNYLF